MKRILLIAFAITLSFHAEAQNNETTEAVFSAIYPTLEDACNFNGKYPNTFIIKGRPSKKAPLRWTYIADKSKISERIKGFNKILKESWGVVCNDTLYVNTHPYTGYPGFAMAHTNGRYILIFSEVPDLKAMQNTLQIPKDIVAEHRKNERGRNAGMMFGIIGSALASASTHTVYFPLLLDTQDGSARALSPAYTEALTEMNPGLSGFDSSSTEPTDEELVDFVERLNHIIAEN